MQSLSERRCRGRILSMVVVMLLAQSAWAGTSREPRLWPSVMQWLTSRFHQIQSRIRVPIGAPAEDLELETSSGTSTRTAR